VAVGSHLPDGQALKERSVESLHRRHLQSVCMSYQ
jgi:hypothetical protein